MKDEKVCSTPQTWGCPICGVPIAVGDRCECGTLIEVVDLPKLPEYFHNFNWELFKLELLEVTPEFEDLEKQAAVFMIVPPVEPQRKYAWASLFIPDGVRKDAVDWAIYNLIEEYKYRRDCSIINELKEKYSEKIRTWRDSRVRITANQRHYISEASRFWDVDMRTLVSLFLAYVLYDEQFQYIENDEELSTQKAIARIDVKEFQKLSKEERKKKLQEMFHSLKE